MLLGGYFKISELNIEKHKESIKPEVILDKAEKIFDENLIDFTLEVLGENYSGKIKEGESVYQAMQNLTLDSKKSFLFKIKEYPSLGIFVEEINGVKNSFNKYWIYYINGEEAQVGISNYILKSGDIITWKLEEGF